MARKGTETELSEQELQFCVNYLDPKFGFNATQAAIAAGYSPKTAAQQASRLLTRVKVKAWLTERVEKRLAAADSKAEKVITELERIAHSDIRSVVSWRSKRVVPQEPIDDDTDRDEDDEEAPSRKGKKKSKAALAEAEDEDQATHIVDVRFRDSDQLTDEAARAIASIEQGKDGQVKIRFHDKQAALTTLAKHHGLLREKIELEPSDDLLRLLDQRRGRALGRKAGDDGERAGPRAKRARRERPQRRGR